MFCFTHPSQPLQTQRGNLRAIGCIGLASPGGLLADVDPTSAVVLRYYLHEIEWDLVDLDVLNEIC